MKNWIAEQTERRIAQFDRAVRVHYPESAVFFEDPKEFHRGLTELWNYLDAVRRIDWDKHLPAGAVCLDLGSGVGWLSAFLSKNPRVEKIYALDSSKHFLNVMRPAMESLMGAEGRKIEPIEGFFTPLLFDDRSLDAVVAASALHHADNLEEALVDIHRALKDGGTLFLVNELPHHDLGYLFFLLKGFAAILVRSALRVYRPTSRALSSSGVLDDPHLGDRRYPAWYWRRAIDRAGFELLETHRTGLSTLKADPASMELVHFICKKKAARP